MVSTSHFALRCIPLLVGLLSFLVLPQLSQAGCPFCNALSGTISDEITDAKVVVMARCLSFTPAQSERELHSGLFQIENTLKGAEYLNNKQDWKVVSIDPLVPGEVYALFAFQCEPLEFGGPIQLSKLAQDYLKGIDSLPSKGRKRLAYFLKFIELEDKIVADDSFNEFARASYQEVAELRDDLDRAHVLAVLRDPKSSLSLRRLFWSFLGICGKPEDSALFDELLARSQSDPKFELGLEAAVACYVSLLGKKGLEEIKHRMIENPKTSDADLYLTILALRVHGQEIGKLPKLELANALRPVLQRIELADQVVPDLWRWEDWSALPELIVLFKKVDRNHHARVPIIQFAMACPLPEAKEALKLFESLDPDAMRRAKTLFRSPESDSSKKL